MEAAARPIDYPDGGEIPDQQEADLAAAMKAAGCKDETVEVPEDELYIDGKVHTTDPTRSLVRVRAAGRRAPLAGVPPRTTSTTRHRPSSASCTRSSTAAS